MVRINHTDQENRRQRITGACKPCAKAKKACDEERPCTRCCRLEISCCDQNGVTLPTVGSSKRRQVNDDGDWDDSHDGETHKRRQITRGSACMACSSAKTACDTYRPCAHCLRKGIDCEQWDKPSGRKRGREAEMPSRREGSRRSNRQSIPRTILNYITTSDEEEMFGGASRSPTPAPSPVLLHQTSLPNTKQFTPINCKTPSHAVQIKEAKGALSPSIIRTLTFNPIPGIDHRDAAPKLPDKSPRREGDLAREPASPQKSQAKLRTTSHATQPVAQAAPAVQSSLPRGQAVVVTPSTPSAFVFSKIKMPFPSFPSERLYSLGLTRPNKAGSVPQQMVMSGRICSPMTPTPLASTDVSRSCSSKATESDMSAISALLSLAESGGGYSADDLVLPVPYGLVSASWPRRLHGNTATY